MDKRARIDEEDEDNDRHFKRHSGAFNERPNGSPVFTSSHESGSRGGSEGYRRSPYQHQHQHQQQFRGGQRGGRFQRTNKREEREPSEDESLATLLFLLGDKSAHSLASNLESMTNSILSLPNPSSIVPILADCCLCANWKTNIYATLIGLLNNVNPTLGKMILDAIREKVCHELEQAPSPVSYTRIEVGFRALGSLVNTNVLSPESWLHFCQQLLDAAGDCQASCLYVWILGTMPWNAWTLHSKSPVQLNTLIANLGVLLKERNFEVGEHSNWWSTIVELKDVKQWNDELLFRPFMDFDFSVQHAHSMAGLSEAESGHLMSFLSSVPSPTWPPFQLTLHVASHAVSLSSSSSSSSSAASTNQSDEDPFPEMGSMDATILYNMVRANLVLCAHNHRKCLSLLTENLKYNKRFNMGRVIVFVILNELLLPDSIVAEKAIYHADLIVGLLASSTKVAKSIGEMINKLFQMMVDQTLDFWQTLRVSEWWSFHLSHFDYKWRWEGWQKLLQGQSEQDQGDKSLAAQFIRDLLARLTRLSYHERIKAILPDYFHPYMPPMPELKPSFDLTSGIGSVVCQKIRAREPISDIVAQVNESSSNEQDRQRLLLEALMSVGSKSFSHSLNMIEKYLAYLKESNVTQREQEATMDTMQAFWSHHRQFLEIWLEKFIAYGIVQPRAFVAWLFKPDRESCFMWGSSTWQMVERLLRRQKNVPSDVSDLVLQKLYEHLQSACAQSASKSDAEFVTAIRGSHSFGMLYSYRKIFPALFSSKKMQLLNWQANSRLQKLYEAYFH